MPCNDCSRIENCPPCPFGEDAKADTELHLVVPLPGPGEWYHRLDVIEALEAAGWTEDPEYPQQILRHKSGAVFGLIHNDGECGLTAPNGQECVFASDFPSVGIVAAALAVTRHT